MMRVIRISLGLGLGTAAAMLPIVSCTRDDGLRTHPDASATTGEQDALPPISPDAMVEGSYCALPGSIVGTPQGMKVVEGGDASLPNLSWLTVPTGFCAHHFANVPETRQLRTGPGGDLFVASPSQAAAGGACCGVGGILVLPDDDHDGLADSKITFFDKMTQTQGMTFNGGFFYYQNSASIYRVPFTSGDRKPSANPGELVTTITALQSSDHFPKSVDVAQDGTIYVTNGSDQGETCNATRTPIGAVFKVEANGSNSVVSRGFRNPIALRCESNHNVCLVVELAKDGSGETPGDTGGREKIAPVRQGDDWGFPCCAAPNVAYAGMQFQDTGQIVKPSDCTTVTPESVSFVIGHTPFGIDFEMGKWPAPWKSRAFVALHGAVGSYVGSRVVAISLDPNTGLPLTASDLKTGASQEPNMMDFIAGWDDSQQDHGRATAVTFGDDGRMYVGDDTNGEIFWVAPIGLMRP
jgi:glucose/arabinose dehydrogenase